MSQEKYREEMKIQWVTMNLRLSGSSLKEETAAKIAAGEYVLDATLEEHLLVTNLMEALPLMETLISMQEELSAGTLAKLYKAISGGEEPKYRKTTPVLFHLSYNPVLPQEIEEELDKLFRKLHSNPAADGLATAVHVHNELIRIYPFDNYSELIARAAMEYELLYCGCQMYPLTLTESQYNSALTEYLKKGRESVILENLRLSKLMEESKQSNK